MTMPHHLCITDLLASGGNHSTASNEGSPLAATLTDTETDDASPESVAAGTTSRPPATAGLRGSLQNHTAIFVREENKKSSFMLQRPCTLFSEVRNASQNGTSIQTSVQASANVNVDCGNDVGEDVIPINDEKDENNICEDSGLEGPTANIADTEKETMLASACITSCISTNDNENGCPQLTPEAQEMFLFGGFELIVNVKTVEVYVIRMNNPSKPSKTEDESYLTTCKGIPARDLPPLKESPSYIGGTTLQGADHSIQESKETKTAKDEGYIEAKELEMFYKFIFVSPGGPKPMERVRLKFMKSNNPCDGRNIIVRILKVKGRLADSMPASKNAPHQQSMPQTSMPFGGANFNPGMPSGQSKDNMGNLASMMAMMGRNGAMGMPMAIQPNPQQQQFRQMQMQPSNQQYAQQQQQQQQQQQNNHQQEKNQAEIVSSIAGLGLFLKSSEERTMNKIESMLSDMEDRIMERLDGIAKRVAVIEQSVNQSNDDHASR